MNRSRHIAHLYMMVCTYDFFMHMYIIWKGNGALFNDTLSHRRCVGCQESFGCAVNVTVCSVMAQVCACV